MPGSTEATQEADRGAADGHVLRGRRDGNGRAPVQELAASVTPLRTAAALSEQALRALPGVAVLVFDPDLRLISVGGDALAESAFEGLAGCDAGAALASHLSPEVVAGLSDALLGETIAFERGRGHVAVNPLRTATGEVVGGVAVSRAAAPDVVAAPPRRSIERMLEPPALPPFAVSRLALTVRLARSSSARVVLLTAPAGFGKTTLLAQWAPMSGRPVAWVTLDSACNDQGLLADALIAALGRIEAAAEPAGHEAPEGDRLSRLADLASTRKPFVLAVDDAHELASPEALAVVGCLIGNLAPKAQVAIASRSRLDLPLGRLLGRRSLVQLTARDLAFSAAEAAALAAACGLDVPARDVEALVQRSDGWPAVVSLAIAALQERGDGRIPADAGRRSIADYVRDVVLRDLPSDEARFVVDSSVLERVNGPLCDAVLERRDSTLMLERLGVANVPLVALDEAGDWYRCNPVLRDILCAELQRRDADAAEQLHLRASRWCEEHDRTDDAARHARLAGDLARAGDLVARSLAGHVLGGDGSSLPALLAGFERRDISASSQLAVAKAWVSLAHGQIEATRYWSAVADGAARAGNGDASMDVRAPRALIDAVLATDGVAAMERAAHAAYELDGPRSAWRPLSCYLEGAGAALRGEREHASSRLREGEQLSAISAPSLRPRILAQLAALAHDEGDLEAARGLAREADAAAHELGLDDAAGTAPVDALMAALLARDGAEAQARERAERALAKLDAATTMADWMAAQVRLLVAEALVQLGDAPQARTLEARACREIRAGARDASVLCERLQSLQATLDAFPAVTISGARHLTAAELRVLRYLPTHLSFRQIGERLFLSRHTVKTEAISTYRKLGVNSRSAAVARARELGLLS
jgi:LuxR family transcriptional regulator, maltose regulon positive regulatory protein